METQVDFSGKKLGCLRPEKRDSRVPMLLSLVSDADLPDPPDTADWYSSIAEWPMDANDTEGDCTSAAVAHAIQQWTLYGHNMSLIMQVASVLAFYKLTKVPDGDGAYLTNVLTYWMTKGCNTGLGIHHIDGFAAIEASNQHDTRCAIAWFGNAIVGLGLPMTAQTQEVWAVVSGVAASGVSSWGDHCVLLVGFDATYVYFVSWGALMKMTWEFYETYCNEAYVAITPSWLRPPGVAPSGFDYHGLKHAMQVLKHPAAA